MRTRRLRTAAAAIAACLLAAAAARAEGPPPAAPPRARAARLGVRVVARWAHDPAAFTQGLVWAPEGFYESTGGYGASDLRLVPLAPGAAPPVRRRALPDRYFAEGLAQVGERLVQLTWRERTAFVYGRATFEPLGSFRYETEGWGLCFDGEHLVMSDGTDRLAVRDPSDFAVRRTLQVTLDGRPVDRLNELECVGGRVYANVWQTAEIVRIDPRTGAVDAVVDARPLAAEAGPGADVLNGIAHRPGARTLYLTGKRWHRLFEVELLDAAGRPVPP